ncbi:MAG TPA: branched-chain amino acid ABC transporter permease [Candidatus Limnocylindria bacterium]|nr:branched-chain amino acid ABC transporter permease [Candidatus Limnocylindria bacterium]
MRKENAFRPLPAFERLVYRFRVPLGILAFLALAAVPLTGISRVNLRLMIMILLYGMLGLGLNVLIGYTGQVSLGHAGFYAIGAYANAILTTRLGMGFWEAALIGACVAALVGLLLGMPTLRLSGTYLTIVTLGFGEIVVMVLKQWDSLTNGNFGIRGIPRPVFFGTELTLPNGGFYWLILGLSLLTALACHLIRFSRTGRAFAAIKEDALAATMMGVKTVRYKILAFVISAFITGLAGAYYSVINNGYIEPTNFTFNISVQIISVVIVGGLGTIRGMYFGAALLLLFPQAIRFLDQWRFVIYGVLLVVMMQFRPQGALGWQTTLPYRLSGGVRRLLGAKGEA